MLGLLYSFHTMKKQIFKVLMTSISPFSVPNPRSILPEPTGGGLADTWDDAGMRALDELWQPWDAMFSHDSKWFLLVGLLGFQSFRIQI